MSIATELQNLNDNILSAYSAVGTKGGTVPADENTVNLNSAIMSIPSGSSEPDYDDATLPVWYQRVEYIKSTGTQYITVPIGFYPTDEVHTVCSLDVQTSGENSLITCYPYNNSSNRYAICATRGRNYQVAFGSVATTGTGTSVVNDGNIHDWEYKARIFMSPDAMAAIGVGGISFGARATNTRLFYGFYGSSSGKLRYYVHKKEDNTGVALYACYRKADSVTGVYDAENDVFYTNEGSGAFSMGRSIDVTLPAEYQEVEYIQSSGTQWIDTGFYPNTTTTKVRMGVYPTSNDVIQGLCGARNTTAFGASSCNIFKFNSNNFRFDWVDASASKTVAANIDTYFDIFCTRGRAEVNSSLVTASVTDSIDVECTFLIGNLNNNGTPYAEGFRGNIYFTKLYDNDTLVRDLVPCYRKADGVIGMYDLVNDVFYTNAGTGTFLKGRDIGVSGRLPAEYQEAAYIENTGTSYIDTGYSVSSDVVEYNIKFFGRPSAASSLFGAERSSTYTGVLWTASGSVSSSLFLGSSKNIISEAMQLGIWHTVSVKTTSATRGSFTVDGYERAFTYNGGVLKGYPIFLFANNTGTATQNCAIKIARFQITDNGTLVRDLVPCYRKADNKPGMYDLVNGVFYTNAGTGEFTVA